MGRVSLRWLPARSSSQSAAMRALCSNYVLLQAHEEFVDLPKNCTYPGPIWVAQPPIHQLDIERIWHGARLASPQGVTSEPHKPPSNKRRFLLIVEAVHRLNRGALRRLGRRNERICSTTGSNASGLHGKVASVALKRPGQIPQYQA
jgi:hypothetical protein